MTPILLFSFFVGPADEPVRQGAARYAEVRAGRGYQGDYGRRLHFGLGDTAAVDRIEVRWPSGQRDVRTAVPADRLVSITEGRE